MIVIIASDVPALEAPIGGRRERGRGAEQDDQISPSRRVACDDVPGAVVVERRQPGNGVQQRPSERQKIEQVESQTGECGRRERDAPAMRGRSEEQRKPAKACGDSRQVRQQTDDERGSKRRRAVVRATPGAAVTPSTLAICEPAKCSSAPA